MTYLSTDPADMADRVTHQCYILSSERSMSSLRCSHQSWCSWAYTSALLTASGIVC